MSESPHIYCLPLLHAPLECVETCCPPAHALRVWPGLPNMPEQGYWAAVNYPFDPSSAQNCVRQMESLSEAALSGVPMQTLASMEMDSEVQKKRKEWQDVAKFGSSGLPPSTSVDSEKILQSAQKALLWAWLIEEKALEVQGIMGSYTDSAAHLLDALKDDADDTDTGLALLASLDRDLDTSLPMLPQWALVLENAAIFLPENAIIAVTSAAMAADLGDRLTFAPAAAEHCALWEGSPSGLQSASVPLWQALNKSEQCAERPWRLKQFTFMLCRGQA